MKIFNLFSGKRAAAPAPAQTPARPWHEAKAGAFDVCTMGTMQARLLTAHGCRYFDGDLPMRRVLALQAALKTAAFGIEPAELDSLLVEAYMEAQKAKDLPTVRARLQHDLESIRARLRIGAAGLMQDVALVYMVVEGENPFLMDPSFEAPKRAVLADPEAENFFLGIALSRLNSFSPT